MSGARVCARWGDRADLAATPEGAAAELSPAGGVGQSGRFVASSM